MMIELISIISIAVVTTGAFYLLDRQMRRFDEEYKQLTDEWKMEREEWARERQALMDRIQAPEVVLHRLNANGVEPELSPVGDGPWISDLGDNH